MKQPKIIADFKALYFCIRGVKGAPVIIGEDPKMSEAVRRNEAACDGLMATVKQTLALVEKQTGGINHVHAGAPRFS